MMTKRERKPEFNPGIAVRMRVLIGRFQQLHGEPASDGRAGKCVRAWRRSRRGAFRANVGRILLALALLAAPFSGSQKTNAAEQARAARSEANLPPRVLQAERFLAVRGWTPGRVAASRLRLRAIRPQPQAASGTAVWLPLGPTAVVSQNFGLVTGRISALALDPSDATGNTLYVGTTGGGVWLSQNADTSNSAKISFAPLTDNLPAISGATDASISIGALAVQPPGGTGVILAGTGDPNDALDSYYGAGILRSTDGGTTWSLISGSADQYYSFVGEGFAGFAWSTDNTELVVAAVSQAYDGALVDAVASGKSCQGLYYSTDGGATWSLATIIDGSGTEVQGANYIFALPDGNAATAVAWNPVRHLFVAAVRYHGYYQSVDGITWTRLSAQPSSGLTATNCPANPGFTGSPGCPIFRGALAVNPTNGDTFAWTVDEYNQDQGLWQDKCSASGGVCASTALWSSAQALQWDTAALEVDTLQGAATIENGDYNLALAAVPSGQETMLLAGANDLWQTTCPYSQGCAWRNTTNSKAGFCAKVGEYQHALEWNASNPQEIFIGNDSGLWRSTDAIGESGTVCSAEDASHFQNLNGSLGSLAEVESISQVGATPYTMMAGLGGLGTVGVKSAAGTTANWPEILGGEGGPVAIDPGNSDNWYVNNAAGVSIHRCSQAEDCTPDVFGLNAVVTDADVSGDGLTMTAPAPFLVDPLDTSQLLIGSCRVWRGPASGAGWSSANAVSSMLDGLGNSYCSGNAMIRSMAAMALPASSALTAGGEVVYVGMYGLADGGATLPGHVLSATYDSAASTWSAWKDLTPVASDTSALNYYELDISSIFIDTHDTTGKTVYVTVAGISNKAEDVQTVYRSTDGGESWTGLMSNLPASPANSVVVDPESANTVYVATDAGVYATQQIDSCAGGASLCWSAFGSGLPAAPVIALSAAPASATVRNLVAATYGRGVWMAPLLGAGTAGSGAATDTPSPVSLAFPDTSTGQLSTAQTVTLTNSGGVSLTSIQISIPADQPFQQENNCTASLGPNSSCSISVQFAPTVAGSQTGALTVSDSATDSPQTVKLSGTGIAAPVLSVSSASLSFTATVGQAASPQTLTVTNTGGASLADVGFQITGSSAADFSTGTTTCGAALASGGSCTVQVIFTPAAAGGATASLVVSSSTVGVKAVSVALTGSGQTVTGLNVSPSQLVFPIVAPGKTSAAKTVTLTNSGSASATSLTLKATAPFSVLQATTTCGATLATGASCTAGVAFAPTLAGSFTGTLTIASPSLASSVLVALSGTGGVPGSVTFRPNPLTFAQTGVGVPGSASIVTITNPDPVTSLSSLTITPAPAAEFTVVSTTCGATLAPLASCTVGVTFTPASAGTRSGTLTVTDSAQTALPPPLTLSGTGFDFALCFGSNLSPCATTSSQTVANGQKAIYHLTIAPLDGTSGSFTLQCGTPPSYPLPSYSSCTFSPTSPTDSSTASVYETVTIATGQSTSSTRLARPFGWQPFSLACGLALVPLALWRRQKALWLVVLLMALAGGVSSCSSSSVGHSSNPSGGGAGITPAGTYKIPVTVTANGVQHAVTLTLVVD
jgi:hypothetical protein